MDSAIKEALLNTRKTSFRDMHCVTLTRLLSQRYTPAIGEVEFMDARSEQLMISVCDSRFKKKAEAEKNMLRENLFLW